MDNMLLKSCNEMGILLSTKAASCIEEYISLLLAYNKKINLTRITEYEDIISKHILDSLSIFLFKETEKAESLIDVGTGAGFPGIIAAMARPEMKVCLLDSLSKRVGFLNECKTLLKLPNITAVHGRAEDLGRKKGFREAFDIVTSRAVAPLNVLVEYCLPFAKEGGYFLAMKGPSAESELKEADRAIKALEGNVMETLNVNIPNAEFSHKIVIIKKVSKTPAAYPRKAGTPEKSPL